MNSITISRFGCADSINNHQDGLEEIRVKAILTDDGSADKQGWTIV
jgi:hypothetical protein